MSRNHRRKIRIHTRSRNGKNPKRILDTLQTAANDPSLKPVPSSGEDRIAPNPGQPVVNEQLETRMSERASERLEQKAAERRREQPRRDDITATQRAEAIVKGRQRIRKVAEEVFKWGAGIKVLIDLTKAILGLFR